MTIPEGWQRLCFDDDVPLVLASLRDADHVHDVTGGVSAYGRSTTG
ncbi:MAG: hypothetical protein QGH15_04810 [Kiritimatiellia bacterium]|jgi:hypothetical protein|nr:hypothetical protein [Kiritimatiellia bacterium]